MLYERMLLNRLPLPVVFVSCVILAPTEAAAYVDPTTGKSHATHVTRSADIPQQNWLPGHRGVDLALEVGADVRAAEEGTVTFAGMVAGTPVVSIDHADGIRTTYQPVHARVRAGDAVTEGQVIGRLAPSTRDEHDGLHWGALTGRDSYINPLTLLEVPAIRLMPVDAPGRKSS